MAEKKHDYYSEKPPKITLISHGLSSNLIMPIIILFTTKSLQDVVSPWAVQARTQCLTNPSQDTMCSSQSKGQWIKGSSSTEWRKGSWDKDAGRRE